MISLFLIFSSLALSSMTYARDRNTLVVPVATITKLDPYMGNDPSLNKVMEQIARRLIKIDDSLAPMPDLAKSWEINRARKEVTFSIDPNSRFHDGTAVTSTDIFRVFQMSSLGKSDLSSQILDFSECENLLDCKGMLKVDDLTFRVFLSDRNFTLFLRKLAGVEGSVYKYSGIEEFIGTGPFSIAKTTDTEIVTHRETFDPIAFNSIVFRKVAPIDALRLFLIGEIDVINSLEFDTQGYPLPREAVRQGKISVTYGLVIQLSPSSIFHDKRVRQALAKGVNKQDFAKNFDERSYPALGMIPKGFLGHRPFVSHLDQVKARKVIDSLVPSSRRIVKIGLRDKFRGNRAFTENLVQDLKAIGLIPEIIFDNFNSILKDFRLGKYDLIFKGDAPRYGEPSSVFISYIDDQFQNISGFSNPELKRLYYDSSHQELSPVERISYLGKMEDIVEQEIPVVPMIYPVFSTWYQSDLVVPDFKELSIRFWDFPYQQLHRKRISNTLREVSL